MLHTPISPNYAVDIIALSNRLLAIEELLWLTITGDPLFLDWLRMDTLSEQLIREVSHDLRSMLILPTGDNPVLNDYLLALRHMSRSQGFSMTAFLKQYPQIVKLFENAIVPLENAYKSFKQFRETQENIQVYYHELSVSPEPQLLAPTIVRPVTPCPVPTAVRSLTPYLALTEQRNDDLGAEIQEIEELRKSGIRGHISF